jgi:uncharacterized protein (UPF0261 family)
MHSLSGAEIGPWADPATDGVFVAALTRHLPADAIGELPHHINDAAFADACVDELLALMARK